LFEIARECVALSHGGGGGAATSSISGATRAVISSRWRDVSDSGRHPCEEIAGREKFRANLRGSGGGTGPYEEYAVIGQVCLTKFELFIQ